MYTVYTGTICRHPCLADAHGIYGGFDRQGEPVAVRYGACVRYAMYMHRICMYMAYLRVYLTAMSDVRARTLLGGGTGIIRANLDEVCLCTVAPLYDTLC